MAERFEYYNTDDDNLYGFHTKYFPAQTFTPEVAHKITSVKLLMYRLGNPGTVDVEIRTTSAGKPTSTVLCSGTYNGNLFTTNTAGLWYEITLGAGADQDVDTQYAIVCKALSGSSGNDVRWRMDASSPTYPRGAWVASSDYGETWLILTGRDFMFEEWGVPAIVTHELTVTDSLQIGDVLIKNPIKVLADSIALSDVLVKNPIKTLTDAIALSDVWEGYKLRVFEFIDGIAIGDTLEKWWSQHYERVFTDGIAIADTLVKSISKVFTDGIKFTDVLTRWRLLSPVRILKAIRNLASKREEPM